MADHVRKDLYDKAPLIEALCELRFADSQWDATSPGRFFDRVEDRFPARQTLQQSQARIDTSKPGTVTALFSSEPRMRFTSGDGARALQIEKDLLVVNHLRPYTKFEDWAPLIHEMADLYVEIGEPKGISSIALRYLDKFEIPGNPIHLEDYFTIYPKLPRNMEQTHGGFMVRVETAASGGHSLLFTFGSGQPRTDGFGEFTLDILDLFKPPVPIASDALDAILNQAHGNAYQAFEGSITEKMKDICGRKRS